MCRCSGKTRGGRAVCRASISLAVALVAAGIAGAAHAADRYWVGVSGSWDASANWSATPGGAGGVGTPGLGDNAYVLRNVPVTVTRDSTSTAYTSANAPALIRFDGSGALAQLNLTVDSNSMRATEEDFGVTGFGVCVQAGGSNTCSTMNIGSGTNSNGNYSISGASVLTISSGLNVGSGSASKATFTQTGGTVTCPGSVGIGSGPGASGLISIGGGNFSAPNGIVIGSLDGTGGLGTFNQTAGVATLAGLIVSPGSRLVQTGGAVGITGGIGVYGGTVSVTGTLDVGSFGTVTLDLGANLSAASLVCGQSMTIIRNSVANVPGGIVLNGGVVTLDSGGQLSTATFTSVGTTSLGGLLFGSGTLILSGNANINSNDVLGGSLDLPITRSFQVGSTTTIGTLHFITLDGGTFSTGALAGPGSVIFNSGTFRLSGSTLTIGSGGPFGSTFQISPAMHVEVTNAHLASVSVDGLLDLAGGSLLASGGVSNSGIIQLDSLASHITGGAILNNGLLSGTGRIDNTITNNSTGIVRAGNADHLLMLGLGNTSSGTIQLLGGIVEFQQSLTNTGTITGRGSLIVNAGLTNNGSITMDSGPSDVFGTITNGATSHALVTGGANLTFHNNVTNIAGSQFKVSTASIAAFLAPVTGLAAFTGAGTTIFESTTSPGPLVTGGTSIVENTGALSATTIREPALIVRGTSTIIPDGSSAATSVLQSLTIDGATDAWTGKLDLTNNKLIVDYTGATPIATIANQIKSGFAGNWSGNGITSTTAHSVAVDGANPHKTALGYGQASTLGISSFGGQSVDATSVLVRYTWSGDANLDGLVNLLDFNALATNYGAASGELWYQGDFNYDGATNTFDFNALASNFNQPAMTSPALGSLVPEPTILPMVLVTFYLSRRRRR